MASEALDIPSLNAEFLITPKTDVVQSVGRVLRAKHAFSDPIIYDIKDKHTVFEKQWLKRKAYYKKQNYRIVGTNSTDYHSNISKWKIIYEPKSISNNANALNSNSNNIISKYKINKQKKTNKNSSSSDKSITNDSDSESDTDNDENNNNKDKFLCGKCLIPIKK